MQLKLQKDKEWFAVYSWFQYPADSNHLQQEQGEEKPIPQIKTVSKPKPLTTVKQRLPTSTQPKLTLGLRSASKSAKPHVKFEQQIEVSEVGKTTEATSKVELDQEEIEARAAAADRAEMIEDCNGKIEATMEEIRKLKEDYNYNLTAKSLQQNAEIKQYEEHDPRFDPKNIDRTKEKFILKPNPILRLDRVVGWHPHNTSKQIYFNRDPKLSQEIIMTQANLLIGFYPPLQK